MPGNSHIFTKWRVVIYITIGLICIYIGTFLTKKCVETVETRCLTDECISTSTLYKWAMDTSIDPCDDFYEFSCGQWNADRANQSVFLRTNNKLVFLAEKLLKAPFEDNEFRPVTQAKIMYYSCMNPSIKYGPSGDLYLKYLKQLGLPELPQFFNTSIRKSITVDFIKLERTMMEAFSMSYFFNIELFGEDPIRDPYVLVTISSHLKHLSGSILSTRNTNEIDDTESSGDDLEGSGIGGRHSDDDGSDDDLDLASNFKGLYYTPEMIQRLDALNFIPPLKDIEKASGKIKAIEFKIYSILQLSSWGTSQRLYTIKSLEESLMSILILNRIVPSQKFINYMKMLLFFIKNKYKNTPKIDIDLRAVNDMFSMLEACDDADLELYMWRAAIAEIDSIYIRLLSVFEDYQSSSRPCTKVVADTMGAAVSFGLPNLLYDDVIHRKVKELTFNIHNSYNDLIRRNKWINPVRREEVLQKSKNMSYKIGQSMVTEEMHNLEEYYKDIHLSRNDFIGNIFDIVIFIYHGDFTELLLGSIKSSLVVNAHYDLFENSINVPKGILNQPMYHLGLDVLHYGALGSIIGHEIIHGFDYQEILKLKTTSESLELQHRIKCFSNQYTKYHGRFKLFTYLKGILTTNENIADTSGIGISFTSYKKLKEPELALPGFENYTHDQLFFIAYANVWCGEVTMSLLDGHSANRYRVTTTLQNSKHFAESFKCRSGTRMNPSETRCDMFD